MHWERCATAGMGVNRWQEARLKARQERAYAIGRHVFGPDDVCKFCGIRAEDQDECVRLAECEAVKANLHTLQLPSAPCL